MSYPYIRGDGTPLVHPLIQMGGGGATPTSPLQLHFMGIDVPTACALVKHWHSVLPNIHVKSVNRNRYRFCAVAIYENCYWAVAIWSSPVARGLSDQKYLELRRMAIADNAPKNTASRMIAWMIREIKLTFPDIETLVSYQDTERHRGTIYKACGWKPQPGRKPAPWNHAGRSRPESQSLAVKVRWDFQVRHSPLAVDGPELSQNKD